jgi:hypothetical protein
MKDLKDTRDQERIIYPRQFMSWMGLMLFMLKLGSRRQLRFELDCPEALANLNRLSGCAQETMAHSDTLNHFLGHVPLREYPRLRRKMVNRLIRMKVLDKARLSGHLLVDVDGTGQLFFRERHCPHCLQRTIKGQTQYYHHVLEAKLVTPEGLAFSIGTEFIENSDPHASKQDCEPKAFARLAKQLKRDFPQLRLCLCLDAIYANGTILSILKENGWKYFITFKQGSLPTVWSEYQALRELCPQNRKLHRTPEGKQQKFAWVHDLKHVDGQKRGHQFHAFECVEQDDQRVSTFAWLTNFTIRPENVVAMGNRGARCRWKIENQGFNIQKNGGFNLEHDYSRDDGQIKNFYFLMQIAHMILQLIECGSLLGQEAKQLFGSLRNLAKRLGESIRNRLIPAEAVDPAAAATIQIRLDTS